MNKRQFVRAAAAGVAGLPAMVPGAKAQSGPKTTTGPVLMTVSGLIGSGNRGALDPALDRMMAKQKVAFAKAHAFDFSALMSMPAVTIRPTLEYDNRPHTLRGPLLLDVVKASGSKITDKTSLLVRAVDGYAVLLSASESSNRRFILATHLDDRPMALGGLGPLWAVYDADRFPDMAAKPVTERFGLCPWAAYHIEVKEG